MPAFIDISGKKFARVTAISRSANRIGISHWKCVCDCGNEFIVSGKSLKSGNTKSCGCLKKEKLIENGKLKKHGLSGSETYHTWRAMKARCYNKKTESFKNYGGRGITVCDEWRNSFQCFYDDMGRVPKGKSIDRIDNNGNYNPSNCKYSTCKEQLNNTRANKIIAFNGESKNVTQWAECLGVSRMLIFNRLYAGWSIEKALTEPIRVEKSHPRKPA